MPISRSISTFTRLKLRRMRPSHSPSVRKASGSRSGPSTSNATTLTRRSSGNPMSNIAMHHVAPMWTHESGSSIRRRVAQQRHRAPATRLVLLRVRLRPDFAFDDRPTVVDHLGLCGLLLVLLDGGPKALDGGPEIGAERLQPGAARTAAARWRGRSAVPRHSIRTCLTPSPDSRGIIRPAQPTARSAGKGPCSRAPPADVNPGRPGTRRAAPGRLRAMPSRRHRRPSRLPRTARAGRSPPPRASRPPPAAQRAPRRRSESARVTSARAVRCSAPSRSRSLSFAVAVSRSSGRFGRASIRAGA